MRYGRSVLTAGAMLLAAAGCDRGPKIVEVEGMVTLDGKPLDQIQLQFSPTTEGPLSTARTDDQGRFVLMTQDGESKGAVVGKHKVIMRDLSIIIYPVVGRAAEGIDVTHGLKPRILESYANEITTPLEIEVAGETHDLKIEAKPYQAPKR